jgi:patatin-like phospholipase/acyl hydrolase
MAEAPLAGSRFVRERVDALRRNAPIQKEGLCLLSLDGGGVRGYSSLMILKQLMENIDPDHPPKPCDIFDMIGGTSTGGYISPQVQYSCFSQGLD